MAGDTNKDINLRIRAKDTSKKTFTELTKAVKQMTAAQQEQQDAAKRGESSAKALESSYLDLEKAVKAVVRQAADVTAYQNQADAVDRARDATREAKKAYDEYSLTLKNSKQVTAEQIAELDRLNVARRNAIKEERQQESALNRTNAALEKAQKKYDEYNAKLSAAGKSTKAQQTALANLATTLDAATDRQREQQQATEAARAASANAVKVAEEYAGSVKKVQRELAQQTKEHANLARSVQNTEASEQRQMERLATLGQRIGKYGVAINDTGGALRNMQKLVGEANQSLEKQEQAVLINEAALKKLEQAEKQAAENELAAALERQRQALQNTANEAVAAANGWRTAAAGSRELLQSTTPLADALRNILDPSRNAVNTLDSLEKAAENLQATFSKIRKPITDLKQQMLGLKSVQDGLVGQGELIDGFRQQVVAVRESRQEYVLARQSVLALSAQLRAADGDTKAIERDLARAQQTLAGASQAFRTNADQARQFQGALRAAGVDTRNLSEAETRLTDISNKTRQATVTLTDAVAKYGTTARKAGEGSGFFEDQGRKTLSMAQRLRGEILTLTATYTGLYGALQLAGDVIDTVKTKQQALAAISVAVGPDPKKQADEWEYLTNTANRYGFSIQEIAKQYGKFAASASKAGKSNQEVRFLFEQVSTLGRAYNLSGDEMKRALLAVEQMLGKGQIMAEEFKGQFAEVIPGAYESAAEKLKMTVPEFTKAMEQGLLDTNALTQILRGLGSDAKAAADQAANGIIAAEGRLANARFQFNEQIAKSGFIDSYTNLLTRLTTLMQSDQGAELAKQIGGAFTAVADAADWAAEHIDTLKTVLSLVGFVYAAKTAVGFAKNVKDLGTVMIGFNGLLTKSSEALIRTSAGITGVGIASRITATALKGLGRAIPFIGWAITIGELVALLYSTSDTFKGIVDGIVEYAKASFTYLKNLVTGNYQSFSDTLRDMRAETALTAKAMNLQADVKAVTGPGGAALGKPSEGGTADPGTMYDPEKASKKDFDKWLANEQKKADANKLNATKRSAKDDMNERLRIIDTEYAPRLAEAQKRAAQDGGKAEKQVLAIIEQQKATERQKYANEHVKRETKSAETRAQKILAIDQKLDAARDRLQSRGDKMDRTVPYQQREDNYVKDALNSYDALERAAKKLGGTEGAAFEKTIAQLKQQEAALDRQKYQMDELSALRKDLDNTAGARDAQLGALKAQFDAGEFDETTYVQKINNVYNQTRPAVQGAIDALRQFGQAHKEAFENPQAFQTFMSNLDEYQAKLDGTGKQINTYLQQGIEGTANSIGTAFSSIQDSLVQIRDGTASWGDLFSNLSVAMGQFFAQLLMQIAQAILQAAILKALMSFFSPAAGAATTAAGAGASAAGGAASVSAGVNHIGGMAGTAGLGKRSMPASVFAGAQKYHTGGMVGFAPDEVPIIAQQGEEVLTRDDPRNRLNGGLGGEGGGGNSVRLIAVDDQRAALTEALKTKDGEQAMITFLRGNLTTVKKMLNN